MVYNIVLLVAAVLAVLGPLMHVPLLIQAFAVGICAGNALYEAVSTWPRRRM